MRTSIAFLCWCLLHGDLTGQIVDKPRYLFEQVSWGDTPRDVTWIAGIMWDGIQHDDSTSRMKTGLEGIFELRGSMPFEDKMLLVACEFYRCDSGLAAVTVNMSRMDIPFFGNADSLFFDEELMDTMWEENADRFGKPFSSRWIPFVAKTKIWKTPGTTVRMARLFNPLEGFILSYIQSEDEMP